MSCAASIGGLRREDWIKGHKFRDGADTHDSTVDREKEKRIAEVLSDIMDTDVESQVGLFNRLPVWSDITLMGPTRNSQICHTTSD